MKEYHNRPNYDITLYEFNEVEKKEIPHILRAKIITPDVSRKLIEVSSNDKLNMVDRVIDQMILLFGNNKEFYNKFDLLVLKDVLEDIVNEVVLKKKQ